MRRLFLLITCICVSSSKTDKHQNQDADTSTVATKYQAKAPPTQQFGKEAIEESEVTTLRWLGMGGYFINNHGTKIMIDPLLRGFDMPVMIDFPIRADHVPTLDAILITHSDNDHYSRTTCAELKLVTREYHSTIFVDSLMKNQGLPSFGHPISGSFALGKTKITLTPADHAWQNDYPEFNEGRFWRQEDCTGFWIETPDGTIWATGDSRLMPYSLIGLIVSGTSLWKVL